MKIAFLVSEIAPYSKTGGLADVAGALPLCLSRAGLEIAVFTPFYREVKRRGLTLVKAAEALALPWKGGIERFNVWADPTTPYPVCFIEHDGYFDRDGLYGAEDGDFPDNGERFAFFSRATLEALKVLPFEADIIHVNDWQTAPALAYLGQTALAEDSFFARMRSVCTIHNLAYQGLFPPAILETIGLPQRLFHLEALEFWGQVNFLKAGILYASAVTTVSPRYSREIQMPEFGFGLDGLLRRRTSDVSGILNGVDYSDWDPASDPRLPARYTPADPSGKAVNKRELLKEFGLPVPRKDSPLLGLVTRLAGQKGVDILLDALGGIFALGAKIIILGAGDSALQNALLAARERYPSFLGVSIGFDDALSRRIYGGSDLLLMPSRFEPCGLTQMYGLKYGAVPVVRATGGLDDTVEDYDSSAGTGTGFKFAEASAAGLVGAVRRATSVYGRKSVWAGIVRNGMTRDFSWAHSAGRYVELYEALAAK
ncbi:MAG: glycogen synthase GlgA [Candidatus Aminicenantales bacterium]|jgi:starch synthase